jgi:hypothetical protein
VKKYLVVFSGPEFRVIAENREEAEDAAREMLKCDGGGLALERLMESDEEYIVWHDGDFHFETEPCYMNDYCKRSTRGRK